MLSSPSPVNGQSSPCRTPVQGQEGFCSSENTPRSASSTSIPASITSDDNSNKIGGQTSPDTGRQSWAGPASPTKQQSPLRKSAVPGDPNSSDDDEVFASPLSRYSLDSLRKQRARMSLTGDKKDKTMAEGSQPARAGAWYMRRNRAAADAAEHVETSSQEATPTKLRSPAVAPTSSPATTTARSKVTSPASASRFSFFSMASTLKGLASPPVSVPKDDELMNIDIDAALFPGGAPADGETFSPAAFKNLQMNATGLLRKFQAAYQDKAIACQELRAERDAQDDEKIEAETRTAHLKMQLEGMAQKATETESLMQALMEELTREKKLRAEEKAAARESGVMSSGMSTISEDLNAEDDQRKKYRRRSGGTTKSDEAGFDTDDESIDEVSVFSRSRSPTLAASISDANTVENYTNSTAPPPQITKPTMLEPPRPTRQSQPQISTFQKLIKGISGDPAKDATSVQACQNCHGQDASVAWDTAGLLRDENRGLKQRVGELEDAVEEALDAVLGVRL